MNFGGFPIFGRSKLQTKIALSTLEAEYIALSQGIRDLVSARNLVMKLKRITILDLKWVGLVSKA